MWIRRVQVIVTNKNDPSKQTVFEKHSIEFEVRSIIGWGADTATVTIYNLDLAEVKFLQNKTFGDLLIEIRAGYADMLVAGGERGHYNTNDVNGREVRINVSEPGVLPTIFSGVLTNAVGFKRAPEHVTTLFCVSKAAVNSTDFKAMKSIPPGATLKQAILSMTADYGFSVISTFGLLDQDLSVVLPTGRVFHDTFLNEFTALLEEHNLRFYISTSDIQIFPDTYGDQDATSRMAKDREPIKIDANTVIGTPIAGIAVFDLNVFLRSDIQPGMVMDISPLLGTELLANGIVGVTGSSKQLLNYDDSVFRYGMEDKYLIESVIHHGATHGQDFQTSIHGVLGGNNAAGLNEENWQQWYARSGMSMEGEGF
ncbi:putative tail protein [Erwinia phage Fougasse]|nr:putative tail protein [Erwinia phage Calisson]WJN63976.1 putative tail protein [Erwinia phage Fougasse]WJN64209.1 putative tail protein [Erwinia phage Nougat]